MQKAIYTTVGIDELLPHVQALKGVGARFVQMHAERNVDDGSYRLVYTFINVRAAQKHIAQDGSYAIENLVVEGIDQYQEIPSISSYYPAVFPFENEAHDRRARHHNQTIRVSSNGSRTEPSLAFCVHHLPYIH